MRKNDKTIRSEPEADLFLRPSVLFQPSDCIWLLNLATIALNKSFHDTRNVVANGWKISRMKLCVASISFAHSSATLR